MENFTKMFLVPQHIISNINRKDSFSELDNEMHKILYRESLPDVEKWKLYSQILQRYLHHARENEKPIAIPLIESSNTDETEQSVEQPLHTYEHHEAFKQNLTKHLAGKAARLYNNLLSNDQISWNTEGEVTIMSKMYKNSDIVQLVSNAVKSKSTTNPRGWNEFRKVVLNMEIPDKILGSNINKERAVSPPSTPHRGKKVSPKRTETPKTESQYGRTYRPYVTQWARFKF